MIARYEGFLTADQWPNWILGSHDNMRIAGHLGPERARVAAMLQLTLRGTPIMYFGEELGMHNVDILPDRQRDQLAIRLPGKGRGRDAQRTPMQWSPARNAGFTSGESWLPVADDYETVNVQSEKADAESMLNLYQRLLAIRADSNALRLGHYTPDFADERVLTYVRETPEERVLVALNFSDKPVKVSPRAGTGRVLASTHANPTAGGHGKTITLNPLEGQVHLLK
jgi:alpha-glucosidase